MKRKLIVGFLALCSITAACSSVYASTEHYTDSSVTGADSGWSDWDAGWADTAADFTKVSLTPGADDTQLNFAWYSEKGDSAATPDRSRARYYLLLYRRKKRSADRRV